MTAVWCVGWLDKKKQPLHVPPYADIVPTRCEHTVLLPVGMEKREPTCAECLGTEKLETCHAES